MRPHRGRNISSPQRELWVCTSQRDPVRECGRDKIALIPNMSPRWGSGVIIDLSHSWRCGLLIFRRLRRLVASLNSIMNAGARMIEARSTVC